ncbi:enoyl-CoA hydratase/isomerase family protein [Nocardia carnea]|uniref:enoyl-CoA hydratase/isomerase family protein n=1 Tax=Nocardia carnea TaxID=37328 RepID=UPI002456B794|nr:enoyl-CoA hydratase-related protein [Nocardia carnea]
MFSNPPATAPSGDTAASEELVHTEVARPGVLLVRLNRPDALNAMNAPLIEALHTVLRRVRDDSDIRTIVLTGAGTAFCAGLDLHGYGTVPSSTGPEGRPQEGMRATEHIANLADALRRARQPVICAINGPAAGGGMALSMLCDIRLMSESATLLPSFIKRGLSNCDVGLSWILPRAVGFSRSAEILLTGRTLGADEASRIGLVSQVLPEAELLTAALDLAATIGANSPFGVWMTKQVMWDNLETPGIRAAIDLENRTQILSVLTADHHEAVSAFLDKRPPEYRNH